MSDFNELSMIKEQEPPHVSLAKEISEKLIFEFGSKEQAEFLDLVRKRIDLNYQNKLKECEAHLHSLREDYDNFLGNPLKSVV